MNPVAKKIYPYCKAVFLYRFGNSEPRLRLKIFSWLRQMYRWLTIRVSCNICGWEGKQFRDYRTIHGGVYRNACCPKCMAHPRHRSLYIYLNHILPRDRPLRLLHFAPEAALASLLASFTNLNYLSVDIDPAKAMKQENITQLSFPDKSFDVIICLHVLEHIEEDRKAMRELLRVLKDDGLAVLDVPIDYHLEKTYEDPTITTPEARTKAYLQEDHVRLYGPDFAQRLEEQGFKVQIDNFIKTLDKKEIRRHGLQTTPFYLGRR